MSSLSEQIMLMKNELEAAEREIKSLEGGRKASAARARKSLQSLKNSSHGLRKSIVEHTKSLPTKSRVRKSPEEVNILDAKLSQAEEVVDEPVEEDEPKPDASKKKAKPKRIPKKVSKE